MPRARRILIEGGLYHVYNRFARGEEVFADPEEAVAFLDLLRDLKSRDDLQVFAWCLLSNHFHLALRTSAVPLSRTMRTLQGGFAKAFNRRWRRSGPLWQSRYQTRLVDSQRYLEQLIFYIHLNPVRAGLVDDPIKHVFCGHRELLGKVSHPLLDVDEALVSFGATSKIAQKAYLRRLNAALAEEKRAEVSERVPWWTAERELNPSVGRAYVDELGRSTGLEREQLVAAAFVELACKGLGIDEAALTGRIKDRKTTRLRQLVATIGIERWEQRAGKLGNVLGKHPDVVSRWARAGAERRSSDREFAEELDRLDATLVESCQSKAKIV
jgi:REP element-mobilizing transposase RayT